MVYFLNIVLSIYQVCHICISCMSLFFIQTTILLIVSIWMHSIVSMAQYDVLTRMPNISQKKCQGHHIANSVSDLVDF